MALRSHIEKFIPVAHVNRINNQVRRRRQAWLDLPAHEIEEVGNCQGQCADPAGQACEREALLERIGNSSSPDKTDFHFPYIQSRGL